MSILKLENVVKRYDKHTAVDNVSFEVPKGSIFGLLGPNGAGKTSLIRIITTITGADEGIVYLDGEKLNNNTPNYIGYLPEERGLYKKMEVGEQLLYLAQLKGLSKKEAKAQINKWFERLGMDDWWKKKVEELSKGMQQKVQFVATVVHEPKLLILDEPFTGLDPINTNLIKDEIRRLNNDGVSIIFSTHRMEQVEEICEHIVLINQGKKVLEGRVADVKQSFKENIYKINYEGTLPSNLPMMDEVDKRWEIIDKKEGELVVKVEESKDSNLVLNHLIRGDVHINSFHEILPTLNEIFIKKVNL
ncbi:MAG: ABC-2 type transport system ATP-binding protein [Paraglaciecola sp.]|jgi:ABC-2 type transport system ATP-binding protein